MTAVDTVTGARSRATMASRIDAEVGAGNEFALFLFDVDFFKTVNDVYGHLRGDIVLRQLADVVTATCRPGDELFRYGGDEFVLLLPGANRAEAVQRAVALTDEVKRTLFPGDPELHLSVSLGVASYPADGTDQAALLACADRRNYIAKHRGRGVAVADDTEAAAGDGSSRLWERDAAVSATHDFLTRVRTTAQGALRITGQPGAGYSRFLAEARRIAAMRGFAVHIAGIDPAPAAFPPGSDVALLVDRGSGDHLTRALAEVEHCRPQTLALIYVSPAGDPAAPPDMPQLAEVELGPWSPETLRIWLRWVLQGEPSRTLANWVSRQSGGLPAKAAAEVARLRDRNGIVPAGAASWTLDPSLLRKAPQRVKLPAQMTKLVGREAEVGQIVELLQDTRLVTLIGVGGIGKTRLSLAAAAAAAPAFEDGVVFVPLETCTDEESVLAEIAKAAGVTEDTLAEHLEDASILLLLDNFEQALAAAPAIAELMSTAAGCHVLATSREPLGIYGEQLYAVPPLALPELSQLPKGPAGVAQARRDSPAVLLFEQRARAAQRGFELSAEKLPHVAALCRRLDGLPLAIELAAAQVGRMTLPEMVDHLGRHLDAHESGPSDRPERQQTLRGALEWSYALLEEDERRQFAALSVFVGGCTAETARAAGVHELDTLVHKSLLAVHLTDEGPRRYHMLETVRAFAAAMLESRGESAEVHRRHGAFFTELAERAAAGLASPDQVSWVDDLERDYPNLRAALHWALDTADVERARQICMGIWRFWRRGSHIHEGREHIDRLLTVDGGVTGAERARLLYPAAVLAATQDDNEAAQRLGEEALRLAGDAGTVAQARNVLGVAALGAGKYHDAAEHFRHCLETYSAVGDQAGTAIALGNLAKLSLRTGEIDRAAGYIDQCLTIERAAGNSGGILLGLECLGDILIAQGDTARAQRVLDESLQLSRELGDLFGESMARHQLGTVARTHGDNAGALAHFVAAIDLRLEVEDREGLSVSLECAAELLVEDDPELTVRLLAAGEALRERHRLPTPPEQESVRAALLKQIPDGVRQAAERSGRDLPLELIIDQVRERAET